MINRLIHQSRNSKLCLQLLIVGFFISFSSKFTFGQNQITVYRASFDQIIVRNNSYHSISLQIGNASKVVISPDGTYSTYFRLNYNNVTYTKFRATYDYSSFWRDSLICVSNAEREKTKFENKKNLLLAMAGLFHGTGFDNFVSIVRGVYCALLGTSDCNELIYELGKAYQSSDTEEQRSARMEAIMDLYFAKIVHSSINESNCVENARGLLNTSFDYTYYASQFIHKQEKWRIELYPYVPASYTLVVFKRVKYPDNGKAFANIAFSEKPSFGMKLDFRKNVYDKNKKRKFMRCHFFSLEYMQTPAQYKRVPDYYFKPSSAYAWNFYYAGYGWEFLSAYSDNKPTRLTFTVEVGLNSNSFVEYKVDSSNSIVSTNHIDNFKGLASYIDLGAKLNLTNWVAAYGNAYFIPFHFITNPDKTNQPTYWGLKFGLIFRVTQKNSFQY